MYTLYNSDKAEEQLSYYKKRFPKIHRKCEEIFKNIARSPKEMLNHAKPLVDKAPREVWSRRLNDRDRVVYEILEEEKEVFILSCRGRYDDI